MILCSEQAWTLAGLQAASGCYGLPVATTGASGATIHTIPFDVGASTQFQQVRSSLSIQVLLSKVFQSVQMSETLVGVLYLLESVRWKTTVKWNSVS